MYNSSEMFSSILIALPQVIMSKEASKTVELSNVEDAPCYPYGFWVRSDTAALRV